MEGARKAKDKLATCLVVGAFLVALLPLISVIWTVLVNGLPGLLDPGFLTTSMNGVTGAFDNKTVEEGAPVLGGIYHALMGTLLITVLATVISVPVGLLTAIYLVEYGEDRALARGHHLLRGRHDRHPLDRRRPVRRRRFFALVSARAPRPAPWPPSRCPC